MNFLLLTLLFLSNWLLGKDSEVFIKKLSNKMTVIVFPIDNADKVSLQILYNVGSKNEQDGEKGIAHLIEHMIFKGTEKLSESDIGNIAHELAGDCNAETRYDSTRYYFNVPVSNWRYILPVMADCMQNCTFKDDLLNSEIQVVVQELRMYNDDYRRVLLSKLMATIFPNHPYHHPIIGYKEDLFAVNGKKLSAFYKKHYTPKNTALVVVGNVDAQEVFKEAELHFGSIKNTKKTTTQEFNSGAEDILSNHTITIYRDVQKPYVMLAYLTPGRKTNYDDRVLDAVHYALAYSERSRLPKKLVEELHLVNTIGIMHSLELFDKDLFIIGFEPKKAEDIDTIITHIHKELRDLQENGLTEDELKRCNVVIQSNICDLKEHNFYYAFALAEHFIAKGELLDLSKYTLTDLQETNRLVSNFLKLHVNENRTHKATLLPFKNEEQRSLSYAMQKESDQLDAAILSQRIRTSPVEAPRYQLNLPNDIQNKTFTYPQPTITTLPNNLKLLHYFNKNVPKVTLILQLAATSTYDSDELPGLYAMLTEFLLEGTQNYTAEQFQAELDAHGIHLHINLGIISMSAFSKDLPKALELLFEIVAHAKLPEKFMEEVRSRMLSACQNQLDDASTIATNHIKNILYQGHPYSKNIIGTTESIAQINHTDVCEAYEYYFTPDHARLSIVGNFLDYDVEKLVNDHLGKWRGGSIKNTDYPPLPKVTAQRIKHELNRDQTILACAMPSINKDDKDYDNLTLFNQIFAGGMHSLLFALREKSGIFYSIHGSVIHGTGTQPGVVYIESIVSPDRVQEAQELIVNLILSAADSITEKQIEQAKNKLLFANDEKYAKNQDIASTFIALDRLELPFDYYQNSTERFAHVTKQTMENAVKRIFNDNIEHMVTVQVGRNT